MAESGWDGKGHKGHLSSDICVVLGKIKVNRKTISEEILWVFFSWENWNYCSKYTTKQATE